MRRQKIIFWVMTKPKHYHHFFHNTLIHDIFEGCDILRNIGFDN